MQEFDCGEILIADNHKGLQDQMNPDGAGLDPNDPNYCVLKAEMAAWFDAFTQWKYDGCNSNVTPNPDDDSGRCYNQPAGGRSGMTAEEIARERCRLQGTVAGANEEGGFGCITNPVMDPSLTMENYNPCEDPRSLCVEEEIDPGGEVPGPPGPKPLGEGDDSGGGIPPVAPMPDLPDPGPGPGPNPGGGGGEGGGGGRPPGT